MGIMRKRICRVPSMMPAMTPRVFPSACMSDSSVNSVVVTGTARNEYGNVNHSRA